MVKGACVVKGVCMAKEVMCDERGACMVRGACMECTAGHCAGGMHPTGMHSCFDSAFVLTLYSFNGVEKTSIVKSKFFRSALAPSLIFMDKLYTKSTSSLLYVNLY